MIGSNLAEKVKGDFTIVKLSKAEVKIPKLKIRPKKEKIKPKNPSPKIPVSLLIDILIKNSVENSRKESKEKSILQSNEPYILIKDDKDENIGGYGTSSKHYSGTIHPSYINYGKLFGYLGSFNARNTYDPESPLEFLNKSQDATSLTLVDVQTMEKGKNHVRYFNSKGIIDKTSLVPIAGMNSAEWEQFKLFMRLDTVMYLLKISTA